MSKKPVISDFGKVRFADVLTVLEVHRTGSVAGAARLAGNTSSQVSKAVARTEQAVGVRLFVRSAQGLSLTDAGGQLLPLFEQVEQTIGSLSQQRRTPRELTIAADAYLIATLLPAIAGCSSIQRVRGLEIPTPLLRAQASANLFEMALLTEERHRLSVSWSFDELGAIRYGLFGAPAVAESLGKQPIAQEQLRGRSFVSPIFSLGERFISLDDSCPLPAGFRQVGHQTQTMHVALDVAAHTGQLVFGPALIARRFVEAGTMREVTVRGWSVRSPLYLASNGDRVTARLRDQVIAAVRHVLASQGP